MSWLSRLLGRAPTAAAPPATPPPMPARRELDAYLLDGRGSVAVVGESFYQPAIRAAVARWRAERPRRGGERIAVIAALLLEPDNPHDPFAVAVHIDGCGQVGHLSRADARAYQQVLRTLDARGQIGACRATIAGSPMYGVWLQLAEPSRALG